MSSGGGAGVAAPAEPATAEAPAEAVAADTPAAAGAGAGADPVVADSDGEDDGYDAGEKKTIDELLEADKEDESLRRYKEALLGGAAAAKGGDSRQVVVDELAIVVAGRPDIGASLSTPEAVAALAARTLVFKEGEDYKVRIRFRVQNEIVTGLKFTLSVYKLKIRADKTTYMLGSYAPRAEPYEYLSPISSWPSGFLVRGNYVAKMQFTDDDKADHLSMQYNFEIRKSWPTSS